MAELIREIVENDIPILKTMLMSVFGNDDYVDLKRLEGMTNHSYCVTRNDGKQYLLRIPGEGTEEMINRTDERKSTELACSLGIDSKLLFFSDDGRKVMEYIRNTQPMNEDVMKKEKNIKQVAEIFNKLHHCGVDTGVRFEVFEMADLYEKIITNGGVKFYDDYEEVKNTIMNIKKEIDEEFHPIKVPCHNDCLLGNWILDENGKLFLVDWEYSGMNEAMWDLSCFSIETNYSKENDDMLLKEYFGRDASVLETKYFIAAKMYVDFLWTLWGLTRVPFDGEFMQEYADNRYNRLKKNIETYKNIH